MNYEKTDSLICCNDEISIKELFVTIKELMNSDVELVQDDQRLRPEASEVYRLWCDNSKIVELTGYKPDFDIKAGLQETINWFVKSENLKRYKTNIYNV